MISFGIKFHGVCVYKSLNAIVNQPKHVKSYYFLLSFSVILNFKISVDLLERYLQ